MSASFLPSILVPLTCLIFPALTFVFMLLYSEREDIA
jgi:photosystem I subunit 8